MTFEEEEQLDLFDSKIANQTTSIKGQNVTLLSPADREIGHDVHKARG